MADPIVYARCDGRPGKESLLLIYRPDSSTDAGEEQITIRARSLSFDTLPELQRFVDDARPIVEEMARVVRDKPIETMKISDDPPGRAVVW